MAAKFEDIATEITKINNLKQWYIRQTDRAGKPGRRSKQARQKRSTIFVKLDGYLSDKPMTCPLLLLIQGHKLIMGVMMTEDMKNTSRPPV